MKCMSCMRCPDEGEPTPTFECGEETCAMPEADLQFDGTFYHDWTCPIGETCLGGAPSGTISTAVSEVMTYYSDTIRMYCPFCGIGYNVTKYWMTDAFCVQKYIVPNSGVPDPGGLAWGKVRLVLACVPPSVSALGWRFFAWDASSPVRESAGGSSSNCGTGFPNDPVTTEPSPPPDKYFGDLANSSGDESTPTFNSCDPVDIDVAEGTTKGANALAPWTRFTGTITLA